MENKGDSGTNKKRIGGIIAVCAVIIVLFLFLFSLFHLPERDPIETPEIAENPNYVESPAGDFQETNDIDSSTPEQVSEMLGELELQYENAKINGEPYAAQQAGFRLAYAYYKAGEVGKAKEMLNVLMESNSYDEAFVGKCQELLKVINAKG